MTRSISSVDIRRSLNGARPARFVAAGRSGFIAELNQLDDLDVTHVDNPFDALGELCTARPSRAVDAVLVDADLISQFSTKSVQALKRFDPAVLLVLVATDRMPQLDRSLRETFDRVLTAPLTKEMLAGMWKDNDLINDDPVEAKRVCEIEFDQSDASETQQQNADDTTQADQPPPSARDSESRTTPEVSDTSREPLGDIDLVDAVMNHAEGVRNRAIELICEQTGWRGVALIPEIASHGVEVVHHGEFLGTLIADAPRPELERWAEWLGYWLALDAAYRRNRTLSLTDELTGAWNRRYFESFLSDCIRHATERRRPVSIMVLDLDDFKQYNDNFGHAAGDEILRETVRLLTSVIRQGDRVCRIGGDEFAVIFADIEGPREPGSDHPHSVEQITKRFQDEICQMHFPKLGIEAPGTLSVSAGLATFPWDGHDAASLLEHADQLALESKRRGKNAITMGPGAQQNCGKH